MQRHSMKDPAQPLEADVVAACLAVLIGEIRRLGLSQAAALPLLCDAPRRIAAALLKGPDVLIVWRLDREAPCALVTADDARLGRFVARANDEGAGIVGLNPGRIAAAVAAAFGASLPVLPVKVGGCHAYH